MAVFGRNKPEVLRDDTLEIKLVKEGRRLKVILGERSVLFSDVNPEQFLLDYRESLSAIRLNFEPTIINGDQVEFTPMEVKELRQEIALHWMRFYICTHQPVHITQNDLAHPQTSTIVMRKAGEKYGVTSERAVVLAAHTVGVSVSDFERWMRVEEDRVNNM
ncbi:MAG TPA: hypothetical protein VGV87_11650 [Blastocatellia bacterium]|nr:hypothetical protein [Blastocatellia bacterium]